MAASKSDSDDASMVYTTGLDKTSSSASDESDSRGSETRDHSALKTDAGDVQRLAWLLDESIKLPGGYRIGIDGILGLIPGIGDAAGVAASSYILVQAQRQGVPGVVMARMVANVLLELLVGVIPVVGDIFDFVFKANKRNVKLLEAASTGSPERGSVRKVSWLLLAMLLIFLIACVVGAVVLSVQLIGWIIGLF